MIYSSWLASLTPLAPEGCVCGYEDGCCCGDAERTLRRYAYADLATILPALSEEQREDCLDEIARVEGYDRSDYIAATDQALCKGVLCAMVDYCRDKGLL